MTWPLMKIRGKMRGKKSWLALCFAVLPSSSEAAAAHCTATATWPDGTEIVR